MRSAVQIERTIPHFPMLKEEPARKDFLTQGQHTKLAEECVKIGPWMAAMFEIAVTYGWRKSELGNEG